MLHRVRYAPESGMYFVRKGGWDLMGSVEKPVIRVGSVTYAMKGRDLLLAHGYRAYMERARQLGHYGCGYGLYVPDKTDEAEKLLRQHGIRVLGREAREGET